MPVPPGYDRVPDGVRVATDEAERMVADAAWTPQQSVNGVITAIGICSGQISVAERLASVAGGWLEAEGEFGDALSRQAGADLRSLSDRLWADQLKLAELIRDLAAAVEQAADARRRELEADA